MGSEEDGNGSGAGANVVGALHIDPLIANASSRRRSISIGMGCGIVGVRIAGLAVVVDANVASAGVGAAAEKSRPSRISRLSIELSEVFKSA